MTDVQKITVGETEADLRLDRYLKQVFQGLKQGQIEKWLRTGQLRVDGKRAKSNLRLQAGQVVRIPPLAKDAGAAQNPLRPPHIPLTAKELSLIRHSVLYEDDAMIVLNKPYGLAVQGGTKTFLHVDRLLDAFRQGNGYRPRLVHRLDKDTTGLLLLAKTPSAARWLTQAFRAHNIHKIYWALAVGKPEKPEGTISALIAKLSGPRGEKMEVVLENGREATTIYQLLDYDPKTDLSWLELKPETGRTHQLRVHCMELGMPILGDGKYGGAKAHPLENRTKMHLHAYKIEFTDLKGQPKSFKAPLPEHMIDTFKRLGFSIKTE